MFPQCSHQSVHSLKRDLLLLQDRDKLEPVLFLSLNTQVIRENQLTVLQCRAPFAVA